MGAQSGHDQKPSDTSRIRESLGGLPHMSLIGRIRASWMRIGAVMLATGAVTGCAALSGPSSAVASSNQWAMFEIPDLATSGAATQLQVLRSIGVSIVRVEVDWSAF